MNKKILAVGAAVLALTISGCATANDTERVLGAVVGGVLGSTIGGGDGKTVAIVAGTVLGYKYGDKIFGGERGHYHSPPRTLRDYCSRRVPEKYWDNRGTRRNWINGCVHRMEEEQERRESRAYKDGYNRE